jgi:hypothetical protein
MESTITMELTMPRIRVHRPRRTAIRTALAWNAIPVALVILGVARFSLLSACVLSAGIAAVVAAILTRQESHTSGTYGHTVTRAVAFRWGSFAALLGWLAIVAGVVAYVTVSNMMIAQQ